jgi:hypothetical protein
MPIPLDNYVIYNRGRITASKLKCFRGNPKEYYLKYEKEMPVPRTTGRHFVIGNAFDDLVSYGKEYFLKKYYIDDGLVTAGLKEMLLKRYELEGEYSKEDVYEEKRRLKAMKLPELRKEYYLPDGNYRIRLTPGEGTMILGMYEEVVRPDMEGNNLADLFGKYNTQVVIEAEYAGIPIRGKLDRFIFIDQEKRRYTVKWVNKFIKRQGKAKRIKLASKHKIIGLIRDRKTTSLDVAKATDADINFYNFEMEVSKWGYDFSMAFYSALVLAKYGVLSDVVLDFVQKKDPYPYH